MSDHVRPVLSLIAALDQQRAIGRGNTLPWHLPADLRRFKALTLGKPVLMGRKTAESLGRALPGRLNIVLTRSGQVPFAGMLPVSSLDEALAKSADASELMVIGGEQIYRLCLPLATRLYLTQLDTVVEGADAWFPAFTENDWTLLNDQSHHAAEQGLAYRFCDYCRAAG